MARNKPENKKRPIKSIKNGRKHQERITENIKVIKRVEKGS
jgi:hypothetical protein